MRGIFSTLLSKPTNTKVQFLSGGNSFSIKLIVKYQFAVRAFGDDPDGSRTHRHGDFEVPTRPLSYGSYIKVLSRIPAYYSFVEDYASVEEEIML